MLKNYFKKIILTIVFVMFSTPAMAQSSDFNVWLKNMRAKAAAAGISQATINANLYNITPSQTAIRLDRKQPEKKKTFAEYKKLVVNENRVQKGRKLIKQHYAALQAVENQYGVPKQFIVALWVLKPILAVILAVLVLSQHSQQWPGKGAEKPSSQKN